MNEKQLEDIRILQQECEREDFTLKLNWETLRSRNGVNKNDFLHYDGLITCWFSWSLRFWK
ncbi:hypothetical protein OKW24_000889 [Peribacillus simplex]|uniref:hypothetical protein n=1 Tax=Peribacillus simplex TaxID=1478 RepID=UPI0024E2216C|nr:hypothetical protein [Peribacillus simplex]MDF9759116.1 hypothetical protein [Peribacillus simplex]